MGRTKPVAKRRRVEEEQAQQEAISELLQFSPALVENAGALATREACMSWPSVEKEEDDILSYPKWLTGLGRARKVGEHFNTLKQLHQTIKAMATTWSSWSGSQNDPRKRAFGILPGTLGSDIKIQQSLDISMPWKEDTGGKEHTRNIQAMTILKDDVSKDTFRPAIDALCQIFRESLPKRSSYDLLPYLCYENLVAVQPNLHCGRELLPVHVDHPLKDGFGIVVVTVSIHGSATILLENATGTEHRTMRVEQGQTYMLSGASREQCAHGILADESSSDRESLNLRFGLHDLDRGTKHPLISSRSILQHWELETS